MTYKVGILGATGRMGLEIAALLEGGYEHQGSRLELADAVARSKKIRSIEGVDVRTLDEHLREPVHGWIDFSTPDATMKLLEQTDRPILIGTTGFTSAQKEKIDAYAKSHPVLLTSNTSPGMNALFGILRNLNADLLRNYRCVLRDEHHDQKKDAPSGTAKTLLSLLKEHGLEPELEVLRAGGIRGTHTIRFISEEEEVEITHRVFDRKIFARGALQGLIYLLGQKKPGIYAMPGNGKD